MSPHSSETALLIVASDFPPSQHSAIWPKVDDQPLTRYTVAPREESVKLPELIEIPVDETW